MSLKKEAETWTENFCSFTTEKTIFETFPQIIYIEQKFLYAFSKKTISGINLNGNEKCRS